ncbi:MAG: alanine racemase [Acidobacteria bacterium]|nr:alanine racemase [Acidobacteriota bacterium]
MPSHFTTLERPTAAYVDLDSLAFNFRSLSKFVGPDVGILAVVKADAYGHGAVECALRLEAEGVDWFGVAIPEEGAELRRAGITRPILCLGSLWPGQEPLVIDNGLTPVVFTSLVARALNAAAERIGRSVDIHVKIDTGMGRLGVRWERAANFAQELANYSHLKVGGLLTHFASAEDPKQDEFTQQQVDRFNEAIQVFTAAGHIPTILDIANSPGTIRHPDSRKRLVRIGGGLFGLLDDILHDGTPRPEMRPVLSLCSRIVHVKDVPPGQSIGYGRSFFTKRDSRIALVPIGYADGYTRLLSNRSHMLVRGQVAPVVGRISMDWTEIDVTDIQGADAGDEVVLIGKQGERNISAADLAEIADTLGYEITCGISPRVPRVYR